MHTTTDHDIAAAIARIDDRITADTDGDGWIRVIIDADTDADCLEIHDRIRAAFPGWTVETADLGCPCPDPTYVDIFAP